MSEWKEYKFTEVATLTNGRAYLQPDLQTLDKIAKLLDVDVKDLLNSTEKKVQ